MNIALNLRRGALTAALAGVSLGFSGPVAAQAAAPKPAAASASPAKPAALPTSPAKKALVARLLQLQLPGIEATARQIVEQPAGQMLQQAGNALQRLPADKREGLWREIQGDARKYADDAGGIARDRAGKLAPTTIGSLLEERFTEDELKQVIALLESPAYKKLNAMSPELQRALVEKLVADVRPTLEPKLKALEQGIGKRLETAFAAANANAANAPAAGASRP